MTQRPEIGLGTWNVYFILKLVLFIQGTIEFHFLNNLAFMAFLFLPTTKYPFLGVAKQVIAIPVGLYLLHDDSFLPPISHAFAQAGNVASFSAGYLFELLERSVSADFVKTLFVISVFYFMFNKILRVSVLVTSAMFYLQFSNLAIVLPTTQTLQPVTTSQNAASAITTPTNNLNEQLSKVKTDFFTQQADLTLPFDKELESKSNFDVLMLSICSLAWEDVKYFHQENHKLFKEFDILFEHFNSATSYSGPAIVRLLQANCGQKQHDNLMTNPSNKNCYLVENLKNLGFDIELMLNHDGAFDNFLTLIKDKSSLNVEPVKYKLPDYLRNFDDSHIYRDKDIFSQWIMNRQLHPEQKKFTFYNTISLHDGVHYEQDHSLKSADTYEKRLITLLDDMYDILDGLKKTNRPIVVIFVPEHGANIKGDKVQMAGMRELPSPAITNLPVGLKIIGNGMARIGEQKIVKEQSSFFAIAHLVNQILEQDVFAKNQFDPEKLLNDLPQTPMLSENEGSTVMQFNKNYYYSYNNNEWEKYDE